MWQPNNLTPGQREERRIEAGRLLRAGRLTHRAIAQRLGVTPQAVGQWAKQLRQRRRGLQGLRRQPHTGRPPRLTPCQWRAVLRALRRGALAAGFPTDRWTLARIRALIRRRFGVRYHAHYLAAKLRASGWSPQVPASRAKERDEELVQAWLRRDWPRIKKRLAAAGRRLSSSMRPASRSSPGWAPPGPRGGARRCCAASASGGSCPRPSG